MRHLARSTISEAEYDQLPPTLRRKFFSSLERLRLAQDGVANPCDFAGGSLHPRNRSLTSVVRPLRQVRHSSGHRQTPSSPSRTVPSCTSTTSRQSSWSPTRPKLFRPEEVAHFAALPVTLRRKYYTRKEQVFLASKINTPVFDAADEAIYRSRRQSLSWSNGNITRQSRPSHQQARTFLDLESDAESDLESDLGLYPWEDDGAYLSRSSRDDSGSMELSTHDLEAFQWLDKPHEELDLSLHDYHAAVAETSIRQNIPLRGSTSESSGPVSGLHGPRRESGHRGLPARGTTSQATASILLRPEPTASNIGHRRDRPSTCSIADPSTTHYRDPTARLKLRVYLASPQKFDEAVEFGFPSLPEPDIRLSQRARSGLRLTQNTHHSFYDDCDDDIPSLSGSVGHDSLDVDSPQTPSVSFFAPNQLRPHGQLDRMSFRPRLNRDPSDSYVQAATSDREMTLRMTLTKPELRSLEESRSTQPINDKPIEQPPLTMNAMPESFWDSLPDQRPTVKRLFSKLRLR